CAAWPATACPSPLAWPTAWPPGATGRHAGADPVQHCIAGIHASRHPLRAMLRAVPPEVAAMTTLIEPRVHEPGEGVQVRGAVPTLPARSVGPLVLVDHIGPAAASTCARTRTSAWRR